MPTGWHVPEALLLLLALLPLVWWWSRRSLSGLGRLRARAALVLRAVVVAAIVVALAEPAHDDVADRVDVAVALDVSRSVPAARRADALRALDASLQLGGARAGELVVFGRDAVVDQQLEAGRPTVPLASVVDPTRSDLQAGLSRAIDSLDPDARGRVVLVSDGNATAGDALAAAARARAAGSIVDVVPLTYRLDGELLVERVSVPGTTRRDEPYLVRVVIAAEAEGGAVVRLWRDGALVGVRQVVIPAGGTVEEFTVTNERAGLARLEATVEALDPDQDARAENNVAHAFVFTPGEARALWVHGDRGPAPAAEAVRGAGVRVDAVAPDAVPLDAGALHDLEAIVLDDVPAAAFSSAQLAAIELAVAEHGVGLVMIGGEDAFGAGEWSGTPVEAALPVLCRPRDKTVVLRAAVVLVLDRSGSMDGEKLERAKEAAVLAARGLSSQDLLGVVAFDGTPEWISPLAPADPARVREQVARLSSGGGTDLEPGLRLAGVGLSACDAAIKHLIVLTDGRTQGNDPLPVAGRLRLDRITTSAVGVGGDADHDLLRLLARAGAGRYYQVLKPADVPRIFVKESRRVARALIREERFEPAVAGESPVLTGLPAPAPLDGFVRSEAKPRAAVPITGPDGAPIVAHWQYGLGRALAVTTDGGQRWASGWAGRPDFAAFWAQVVRWTSRDVEDAPVSVTTARRGDRGVVLVDAVDESGEVLEDLTVTGVVQAPGGERTDRPLALTHRGGGRYEGDFPADEAGVYALSLRCVDAEGRARPLPVAALVVPYSDEHRALRSNEPHLAEIARVGGGRVVQPWELEEARYDPWSDDDLPPRRALTELWPFALACALFAFLLDVAVRRVAIDLRRAPPAPAAAPAAAAGVMTGQLLSARARARDEAPPSPATAAPPPAPVVEPRPVTPPGAKSAPAAPPLTPGEDRGSFTSRLLDAKRRARGARDDAPPPPPA
jgi:uncharacterized membrane protein